MSEAYAKGLVTGRHHLITQRLRQRRDELGLTQKQIVTRLARCGLQTTNRALSSLEHGSGLDVAKLPELATALDCTVTFLLGLTDDPHRWEPDEPPAVPARRTADRMPSVPSRPDAGDDRPQHGGVESLILGAVIPDRPDRRRDVRD